MESVRLSELPENYYWHLIFEDFQCFHIELNIVGAEKNQELSEENLSGYELWAHNPKVSRFKMLVDIWLEASSHSTNQDVQETPHNMPVCKLRDQS